MRLFGRRLLLLLPWRRRAAEREMLEELRSLADIAGPRALGNLTRVAEDARAQWGWPWLDDIGKDLRYAIRGLGRYPGFTATVLASLVIGIGASTTLFTLINAVQGKLLPVARPGALIALGQQDETAIDPGFTYQQYQRLTERLSDMTLAGYSRQQFAVRVAGATELPVEGELVSGTYFPLLGIHAIRGRLLQPEDDRPGAPNAVAVLSDAYWNERFGRDPDIVGRILTFSGSPFTIVGITPPHFFGIEVGTSPRVFVPLTTQPVVVPDRENLINEPRQFLTWVRVIGEPRPSVPVAQLQAQLTALLRAPDWQPPDKFTGRVPAMTGVLTSVSTGRSDIGERFSTTFVILAMVVGTVLVIACSNIANLALARAAVRRPEFALRAALGAGRARIIRLVVVEALVLAALAGAGAVALSYWATRALVMFASTGQTPIALDLTPDLRVIAFATVLSTAVGLAFGLAPALRASRAGAHGGNLRDLSATRDRTSASAPARAFLIVQVALSITLLASTQVFVSSLQNLMRQAGSISAQDRVLTVRVAPRGSDQRNTPGVASRLDQTYRALLERVQHVPGVAAASMANTSPLTTTSLLMPVTRRDGTIVPVRAMMVYPHYFAALGLHITSGRDLDDRDLAPASPSVALVNQAYVRRILNGVDPLASDETITISNPRAGAASTPPIAIVGIVADSPYPNLREQPVPIIYQPFLQTRTGRGQMVLHVRTAQDATAVAGRVREIVQNVDPDTPSFAVLSLADELDATLIRERLTAMFAVAFSAVVIALIAVGLYGLTAFTVSRRVSEIGLRLAIGATGWDVYRLVLQQTAQVTAFGVAAGVAVAWVTMRVVAGRLGEVLFNIRADDPWSLGTAMVGVLFLAGMASFVPARRAMRINPVDALRDE